MEGKRGVKRLRASGRAAARPDSSARTTTRAATDPAPLVGPTDDPIGLAFDDRLALFLDVDGTLLDIAARPDAVTVPPDLVEVLRRLASRLDGALALVSGRSIAVLDRLFPRLGGALAGQHGAELRARDGPHETAAGTIALPEAIVAAVRTLGDRDPGIVIETKGLTMAVHYRPAPERGAELEAALRAILEPSDAPVALRRGKFVFEIAPEAIDKGRAVEHFMRRPPFAGRRPVFIGDDVTDEDGFAAVARMGGLAIRVGDGGEGRYDHRIESAAAVRAWLRAAAKAEPHASGAV